MKYGKTESESLAEQGVQCRQIVKEIMKFGTSQQQLLKIMELLALELENIEYAKQITVFIKNLGSPNIANYADNLTLEME